MMARFTPATSPSVISFLVPAGTPAVVVFEDDSFTYDAKGIGTFRQWILLRVVTASDVDLTCPVSAIKLRSDFSANRAGRISIGVSQDRHSR